MGNEALANAFLAGGCKAYSVPPGRHSDTRGAVSDSPLLRADRAAVAV
jgi:hypothetical protein